MNTTRRILAAPAGGLLLALTAVPDALASPLRPPPPRPPGWNKHPPLPAHTHTAVTGGMAGWQITLIVAAAVLLAALTVTAYRIRATRRRVTASPARAPHEPSILGRERPGGERPGLVPTAPGQAVRTIARVSSDCLLPRASVPGKAGEDLALNVVTNKCPYQASPQRGSPHPGGFCVCVRSGRGPERTHTRTGRTGRNHWPANRKGQFM
jgi:hypothetical protein